MATDTLENLFGSAARVKLLKLFLMNPDSQFSIEDACRQISIRPQQCKTEIDKLVRLQIVRAGMSRVSAGTKPLHAKRGGKSKLIRTPVFFADKEFPLFPELRTLILKSAPHAKGQLTEKIKRLGNMKLAILSGVFIDNPNARVDLLLVGDSFRKPRMNALIRWLESEFGKQLNYVAMSSQEYRYRTEMYDRFLRDILESPHEAVINKLGVGAQMN